MRQFQSLSNNRLSTDNNHGAHNIDISYSA